MITEAVSIDIQKTAQSRLAQLPKDELIFGRNFSDHMFVADYRDGEWHDLRIVPYGKMPISPSCLTLHYGQAIFEGMKAFRNDKDEVLLFRPEDNVTRFNRSATRMCMPEIPQEIFMEGLVQLLKLDSEWIPTAENSSLYLRPFMFATDEYLGVKPSSTYRFMIITSPVGSFYAGDVRVMIETEYVRSCEGAVGFAKAAGNYGSALYPARLAQEKGYHQLVWTDAKEHKYIEESGTMNVMFVIDDTLVTPSLTNTILDGITRDSVLAIARSWGMKVEERRVSIDEIIEAQESGRLKEMFGVGTAANITHIVLFCHNGKDHDLPPIESREFSNKVSEYLADLRSGSIEDPFGWVKRI